MKRVFAFFGVIALVVSLFTCISQETLEDLPFSFDKQDLPDFTNIRGAILDSELYALAELVQWDDSLTTKGPGNKERSISLKQYAPIPGNQGNIGSCGAWAASYAARTIIESIHIKRTDKVLTTKMAYSPIYLYLTVIKNKNITYGKDAILPDTVNSMRRFGLPRKAMFEEFTVNIQQLEQQRNITPPVNGVAGLFEKDASPGHRIDQVKKSLQAEIPVIIGLNAPNSFKHAKDVWVPEKDEISDPKNGHALCVIGYDDNKYGGAFEVMNSWGEEWGNDGFIWIQYDTFGKWVEEGWHVTVDKDIYNNALEFTGKASIEVQGKRGAVQVILMEDGIYRLPTTLKNGTQLRLRIENAAIRQKNEKIYTYAFYTNPENNRSVRINGNEWITPGNVVILYFNSEQNIDSIISAFDRERGNISSRLENILGNDFVLFEKSKYEYSSMQITANLINERSAAGMVLSVSYDTEEKPINNMIPIEGGTFTMGSPGNEKEKKETVKDFYIGETEVTVVEFRDFVNATGYKTTAEKNKKSLFYNYRNMAIEEREGLNWRNPGITQEDNHPVVHISWLDAVEYCIWRSKKEGLTPYYTVTKNNSVTPNSRANGYRLPTEAEWEYACRAGTTTLYNTGRTISPNQANYEASMIYKTTPVRKYAPNQLGVYDMHGNVSEWCTDIIGNNRVTKGGTWYVKDHQIHSACRKLQPSETTVISTGFRLARNGG